MELPGNEMYVSNFQRERPVTRERLPSCLLWQRIVHICMRAILLAVLSFMFAFSTSSVITRLTWRPCDVYSKWSQLTERDSWTFINTLIEGTIMHRYYSLVDVKVFVAHHCPLSTKTYTQKFRTKTSCIEFLRKSVYSVRRELQKNSHDIRSLGPLTCGCEISFYFHEIILFNEFDTILKFSNCKVMHFCDECLGIFTHPLVKVHWISNIDRKVIF